LPCTHQLAASVALHRLRLTVACEVVGTTALQARVSVCPICNRIHRAYLVASSRAGSASAGSTASKAAAEAAAHTTTRGATGSTTHSRHGTHSRRGAVACEMSAEATGVAAAAGSSSAQTQSWAVSLHLYTKSAHVAHTLQVYSYMTEALAVVALLGCIYVSLWFRRSSCVVFD
jgi:hypothetical protein